MRNQINYSCLGLIILTLCLPAAASGRISAKDIGETHARYFFHHSNGRYNREKAGAEPVLRHCGKGRYHEEHKTHFTKLNQHYTGNSFKKRLVGGDISRLSEWPWLVSIQFNETFVQGHGCGGSLISPQWILTAAHCLDWKYPEDIALDNLIVRVGEHHLYTDEDTAHEEIRPEMILFPPQRNVSISEVYHDIALVKLSRPVQLTENVNIICLPNEDEFIPPGKVCLSSGWGRTKEGAENVSEIIRHLKLPIISAEECRELYKNEYEKENDTWWLNAKIRDDMLCAGYLTSGMGPCHGDSGGPLVCYDHSYHQWVVQGIVSFGQGCARESYPGVFTRVTSYLSWIENTIANN